MILRLTQELEVESAGAIDCARAHETSTKLPKSDTTIVQGTIVFHEALEESVTTISYDSPSIESTLLHRNVMR